MRRGSNFYYDIEIHSQSYINGLDYQYMLHEVMMNAC